MDSAFSCQHLLPAEVAQRLAALASARGVTEDTLVVQALGLLFELASGDADDRDWESASQEAFAEAWDNPDDARYDDWRALYGVPAR